MNNCPLCGRGGAYIGFKEVDCRNWACDNYKAEQEKTCVICGRGECNGMCIYSPDLIPAITTGPDAPAASPESLP